MKSHLSRKEIKRDEVRDVLAAAFVFIQDRQRLLLQIAGGVVVAVLLSVLVVVLLQGRESRAQESLVAALLIHSAAIDELEPDPDHETAPSFATKSERTTAAQSAFREMLEAQGSTRAGGVARVYLGEIALEAGDSDTARRLWGEFLDRAPRHVLSASVVLNLVNLDRREGNFDGAIARLEALDSKPTSLPQDTVLFELGQALDDAGRSEEAQAMFQRLVDEHPRSPYALEAQRSLAVRPS